MIDLSLFSASPKQTCKGITVILPVRGIHRLKAISVCIEYIRRQNILPLEILGVEEDSQPNLKINTDKHIFLHSSGPFNKSKCINCGVANAKYDLICVHDADMIMPRNYLKQVCDILSQYEAGHLIREIFYLSEVPSSEAINSDFTRQWTKSANFNCHGGSIFWTRPAFIRCGGMDEEFAGNGSEDSEMFFRLKATTKFYDTRHITLLHMPHTSDASYVAKNQAIWQKANSIPLDQRIKHLRKELEINWSLA